jgi:RNase H-fold protein (predicted Holliday junction resolvase)
MSDENSKNKTISFRTDSDTVDWLEGYAENELDTNKSELLRDHIQRLEEDPLYRAFHTDLYNSDTESFEEFLEETDQVDIKWVDQRKLSYERLSEAMIEVHSLAERGYMDKAEEIIDGLKDEGYEREGIVLDSFSANYRD